MKALSVIAAVAQRLYVVLDDGDLADANGVEGVFDLLRSIAHVVGRNLIEHFEFSNPPQ